MMIVHIRLVLILVLISSSCWSRLRPSLVLVFILCSRHRIYPLHRVRVCRFSLPLKSSRFVVPASSPSIAVTAFVGFLHPFPVCRLRHRHRYRRRRRCHVIVPVSHPHLVSTSSSRSTPSRRHPYVLLVAVVVSLSRTAAATAF